MLFSTLVVETGLNAFIFIHKTYQVIKAYFHYERRKEHSLFLLLIFPRLKLKRALSKAKKSIKQTKNNLFVVETGLKAHQKKQRLTLYFMCILFKRNDQTNEQTSLLRNNTLCLQNKCVVLNARMAILKIKHV